jgi:hypothetical protein
MADAGITALPAAVNCVVRVGNRISPGNPSVKADGTVVRTLWGALAWQLGGRAAFETIRNDDERATNPRRCAARAEERLAMRCAC